jgi:hypothetical protein
MLSVLLSEFCNKIDSLLKLFGEMTLSLNPVSNYNFRSMKIFKTFIFSIAFFAAFSSCKTKSNGQRVQIQPKPRLLLQAEIGNISEKSEDYTIGSAEIKDNLLTLNVTFECGCNPHQFSFAGSEMIAKSLPPIRSVKLILKKVNGEGKKPCKEKSSQIIDVDISTMSYQQISGNEIYLNIAGYDERILYTYK